MNERGAPTPAKGEDKIAETVRSSGGRIAGTGKDKEASGGGNKMSAKMPRGQSKKKHKARRMQEVQVDAKQERRPKRHKRSPSVNFHEWQQARDKAGHVSSARAKVDKNVCSGEDPGKVLADHIYNTICPAKSPEKLTVLVDMQSPAAAHMRRERSDERAPPGAMLIISELKARLLEERARREAAEAKFQAISLALGEMAAKVSRIVEGVPAPERAAQPPELHN